MYVQMNIYSYSYAFVCTTVRARIGTTESTEHNTEKTLVKGKRPLCLPFQSNRTPLSPLSFSLCPRFGLAVLSKSSLPFSSLFPSVSLFLSCRCFTPFRFLYLLRYLHIAKFTRNNQQLGHSFHSMATFVFHSASPSPLLLASPSLPPSSPSSSAFSCLSFSSVLHSFSF